ncbi:unnamed protein product [Moneuplotes crassus]|uniref:Uncharacterized protein n=1 Tax=Euplotes crassus TaxID=5936 RepID=A0AAD2CXC2_EUPCR|nr:unnamed protein product [Moneuplotes crassus]
MPQNWCKIQEITECISQVSDQIEELNKELNNSVCNSANSKDDNSVLTTPKVDASKYNNPHSARAGELEEVDCDDELIETLSDNPFENYPDYVLDSKDKTVESDDCELSYSKSFPNISKFYPKEEDKLQSKENLKRLSEEDDEDNEEDKEFEEEEESEEEDILKTPSIPQIASEYNTKNPFSPDYSSKSLSQSGFDRASNALTNRKQVPDHNYSNSTFGTIPACTNFMVNIPENKMNSEFISSASVSYNPFIIALHNQSYYKEMSETATNKTQKDDKPVSFMQMALQQQNQEIQRIRDEMFAKRLH